MDEQTLQHVALPVRWLWLTWGITAILMIAIAAGIYLNERQLRLREADERHATEIAYIQHIVGGSLHNGNFEQVATEVEAWGRLNSDTLHLGVTAENGFAIAAFTRKNDAHRSARKTAEVEFSYHGKATLVYEKSLEAVYAAISKLGWQLVSAATISLLFSLLLIHQLYKQRRQTQLAHIEYQQRLEMQKAMETMATHDALTGLPNRHQLDEQLGLRLAEAQRFDRRVAVLFVDLDNFKQINDSFGHNIGDELLSSTTRRMQACLRSYDLLVRFGGDEFVVVLANIADEKEVDKVAQKLLDGMRPTVNLAGQHMFVSATIGISIYPDDGSEPADLLRHADAAMYLAKENGKDCYRFFTSALNEKMQQRQKIESGLHRGLANREFYLVYQPKLDLAAGKVRSCEGLIRWRSGDTQIPPSEFIPIVERTVLMRRLEAFVISEAVRQRAAWQSQGISDLRIDVNLSGSRLLIGDTFSQLEDELKVHDVKADQIGIELTEHTLIEASAETLSRLNALSASGSRISLDDFGTGYSSLGYLKRLPVDVLKIDRAFIRELPNNPQDCSIVSAIIGMGHSLEKRILAEGIETREQLDFVKKQGCDLVQGYLICQPIPADQFATWLLNRQDNDMQAASSS